MKFDRIFRESTITSDESETKNLRRSFFESVKIAPLGRFFLYLNSLLFELRVFEGVVGDLLVCFRMLIPLSLLQEVCDV